MRFPAGRAALAALIDDLLDAWIETADEQAAGGNVFGYAEKKSPHRLLHMPLAPEIANLSAVARSASSPAARCATSSRASP